MASKGLERFYLDGFLKAFPRFEVIEEREAPDFILRDELGLLRLEVGPDLQGLVANGIAREKA